MNKIKRSSRLLKASFAVLFREKKLLLFPFITIALAIIIALFYIAPIALYPTGHSYFSTAHWSTLGEMLVQPAKHTSGQSVKIGETGMMVALSSHWWATPFFTLVYFTSMFFATFSNVAFYHEIMQALNGEAVSIRRGFRFATARWRAVLLWSLFAGLVGYIISAIEERVGLIGKLIASFIGIAWSAACIFIIPALVREPETANPLKLLRSSAGTLKRSWGELVIGFVGLELAFGFVFMMLLLLVIIGAGAAGFYLGFHFHLHYMLIFFAGMGSMLLIALPLTWVAGVVNCVYRCALYIYATEGVVPGTFDKELLDSAWKVK